MRTFYNLDPDYSTNPTEFYWFQQAFTPEEIDKIIADCSKVPTQKGTIAGDDGINTLDTIRKSTIRWVPQTDEFSWIYWRIADLVTEANSIWKFDLHSMPESIQYTEYFNNGGHYDWHQDIGPGELSIRKVSVTIQLSDSDEYEGGDLEFLRGATPEQAPRGKGVAVLFPSYLLHRVTPLTGGTRRSLVLWLGGSHYK